MALTVGSDTYCLVSDATTWHESMPEGEAWVDIAPDRQESLLRLATRLLDDHVVWSGEPAQASQALAFPRSGLETRQGGTVSASSIPNTIRNATAEFALALDSADRAEDSALVDLGISEASGTKFAFGPRRRVIPARVLEMIPGAWIARQVVDEGSSGSGAASARAVTSIKLGRV